MSCVPDEIDNQVTTEICLETEQSQKGLMLQITTSLSMKGQWMTSA